jgi:hypothetical protein
MIDLAVSFLPFALVAIVLVWAYKLRGQNGLWSTCATVVVLLVIIVLAGELRPTYREWPIVASVAMVVLAPPLAGMAVLATDRVGIGWVGQTIAAFVVGWLGMLGIAILLVAIFPGHFFI